MLKFQFLRFPVTVEPFFWLTAALLSGAFRSTDFLMVALGVGVIFGSILVHELGHGLAARHYGADPWIVMHGFGGYCAWASDSMSRVERIFVTLAGPAFGFALAAVCYVLLLLPVVGEGILGDVLGIALYINIIWNVLNLLPVHPLDGGQILRDILGPERFWITRAIGLIVGIGVAVFFYSTGHVISAIVFAMMAMTNLDGDYYPGPSHWSNAPSARAVAFKKAQGDPLAVFHQCAVCGRTDQSDPEITFRVAEDGEDYCSEHLPKKADLL